MSTLREVQLCGLEILKAVVGVCEKHKITYYLCYGTLLGAVRHQGFIPWDNDIDIEMPVEDYKRFLKIAPVELPQDLFLQTYFLDPGYNEMFAKVRRKGTTSLPVAWKKYHINLGIGIDIFPLVGLYQNQHMRRLQDRLLSINRALLSKEFALATQQESSEGNWKIGFLYFLPIEIRHFICKINETIIFKRFANSDRVSTVEGRLAYDLDRKAYGQRIKNLFEGEKFCVPKEFDYILTEIYGDYMTPPPVEERNGHEGCFGKVIYDCDKDYSYYQ